MSNSSGNGARVDRAGSADASSHDIHNFLYRIENYVIALTKEFQTLNERLEEYGKQINRNSHSISSIEKAFDEHINNSNVLEMINVQKNALENRLSIECREREKEELVTSEHEDKTSQNMETNSLKNIDGLTASSVDTTEELASNSQDEGTSHLQDTESSNVRNAQSASSVEPTEEHVADIAEDETSNTEDTIPSNDMDEVATSDVSPSVVLPSEDLITTEPEDKPSQNQATNSPNNIDGPTASSVDITEELAASSQDKGTSEYQGTESANTGDVQATSNVEPTEHETDIREDKTSNTEDTIPSNDMDPIATSDESPSDVLPSGNTCVNGDSHEPDLPSRQHSQIIPPKRLSSFHPLALGGEKSVFGCDRYVPSEESVHFAKNRKVWTLFVFGDLNFEDSCKSKAKPGTDLKKQELRTKSETLTNGVEFIHLHQITTSENNNESTSSTKQSENVAQGIRVEPPDFHQQTKSDIEDKSASPTRHTALMTQKRLDEFSNIHRRIKADKGCESSSSKVQTEYLTFKLENEISDLYFHERTKFEKKDETTSRIIRREYISSSIRGDFSDFSLLDKSDEEEKYAPRKKQTGNLSHLVGSDSKKLLEKLQSDFDDWEEKNRRRGKFGRRERP